MVRLVAPVAVIAETELYMAPKFSVSGMIFDSPQLAPGLAIEKGGNSVGICGQREDLICAVYAFVKAGGRQDIRGSAIPVVRGGAVADTAFPDSEIAGTLPEAQGRPEYELSTRTILEKGTMETRTLLALRGRSLQLAEKLVHRRLSTSRACSKLPWSRCCRGRMRPRNWCWSPVPLQAIVLNAAR